MCLCVMISHISFSGNGTRVTCVNRLIVGIITEHLCEGQLPASASPTRTAARPPPMPMGMPETEKFNDTHSEDMLEASMSRRSVSPSHSAVHPAGTRKS